MTATGYVFARARRRWEVAGTRAPLAGRGNGEGQGGPVRVLAVELSRAIPALPDRDPPDGARYRSAQVLVRLHGQPLGLLRHDLPPGGLTAQDHADLIAARLAEEVDDHLRQDGLPGGYRLSGAGLGVTTACAAHRQPGGSPFVSVVVPTRGREEVLRRSLDTLCELDYPNREIIVVDNRPERSDAARLVTERVAMGYPVRYASEPRQGVSHARNRGLTEARGTIVAFADDDVIVDREWLRALVGGFTDLGVAAVTGLVLARELETPAQRLIEEYGAFGKGSRQRRFEAGGYDIAEHGRVRRVPVTPRSMYPYQPWMYGTGANMAFRTDVLRRLHGFDPLLGSPAGAPSGEDIDALMRVVLAGHAVVYEPSAIVWHNHNRELAQVGRTIYRYGVGYGAVMTKCLLTGRTRRREVLRRGIAYALSRGSRKNERTQGRHSVSLTARKMVGLALGPAYYLRGTLLNRSTRTNVGYSA